MLRCILLPALAAVASSCPPPCYCSRRQAVFLKRKNGLLRRAMELSVLCDCEVAVMVFAGDGRLATYASSPMEQLLRRYSETCGVPHEAHTTQDVGAVHRRSWCFKEGQHMLLPQLTCYCLKPAQTQKY